MGIKFKKFQKKLIIHSILFFCIPHLCLAQKNGFQESRIINKNYFEEIPFNLVLDKIVIPVTIENQVYNFLLDTGAPNLISRELRYKLNVKNSQNIVVSDANNKKDSLELITINNLKIGNVACINSMAIVNDIAKHPLLKCYKIDGFIGSNFFKNAILKIDYNAKKIIITDKIKQLYPKSKGKKLYLLGNQIAPYVKIEFKGNNGSIGQEQVLVDTGMDGFYELTKDFYQNFLPKTIFEEIANSEGAGSIGLFGESNSSKQFLLRSDHFKLDNTIFKNLYIITSDDNNSKIGLEFAKYGDIIIDFKNKRFYYEAVDSIMLTEKVPKITPTLLNDKIVVGYIWDSSLKSKLSYGDLVLKINNEEMTTKTPCEILYLKKTGKQNKVNELIIRTKNNIFETIIEN